MQQSDSQAQKNPDRGTEGENLKSKRHPRDFHSNFRNVSQRFHRWQYKVFCTELWEKHRSYNSTPWHFELDLFFCTRHLFAVTWRGKKHSMFVHYSKKKKKSCYPCYVFSPSHRQCLTASCTSAADFTQFWQKNPPKHYYITLNSTPALCASFLLFWII